MSLEPAPYRCTDETGANYHRSPCTLHLRGDEFTVRHRAQVVDAL